MKCRHPGGICGSSWSSRHLCDPCLSQDDNNDAVNGLDELEAVPEDQAEERDDGDDEELGAEDEEDEGEDLMNDNMNR